MKLHILGSGKPGIMNSTPVLYLLEIKKGELILVECTGMANHRIRQAGLNPLAINQVILSHLHPDHAGGLAEFVQDLYCVRSNQGLKTNSPISILGPSTLKKKFPSYWNFFFEGEKERALSWPELEFINPNGRQAVGEVVIQSLSVHHSFGQHEAYSYRVETQGKSFVYSGDTSYSEKLTDFYRGADLLLHEASGDGSADSDAYGHCSAFDAGKLAKKAGVKKLVLTHCLLPAEKTQMECRASGFAGKLCVAEDGQSYNI